MKDEHIHDEHLSETNPTKRETFRAYLWALIDRPVTIWREKVVDPLHEKNKLHYYHRKFQRVPTIDECQVNDHVCIYEANTQYRRDKQVDSQIIHILRERMNDCMFYYGEHDQAKHCQKLVSDYEEAAGNWFCKYGDLGFFSDVTDAYMKQKHRMIWERRHGVVGSGTNPEWKPVRNASPHHNEH